MDRQRGERSGDDGEGGRRSRTPPWWSSGSPTRHHQRYPRGGCGGGGDEGFYGGRHHPYKRAAPEYPPAGGNGGFRGGFGRPPPVRGGSPDHSHGNKYVKLFVGSIPRTATEDDIRPLFEEHGNVIEVAFAKDKRTGQQQGCCFVRYATSEEADSAIRALHNQYTWPGGLCPIQVRYADGERERDGPAEDKIFVASLNKQAAAKEIEEIFSRFGRVEDVYIVRDGLGQSRGFGFVKFSNREMAAAAINALNEKYVMRGCNQPLILRFAEPKRSRPRERRAGPAFEVPCFSPRSDAAPAIRPTANFDELKGQHDAWHPSSLKSHGVASQTYTSGSSGISAAIGGVADPSSDVPGTFGGTGGSADGSLPSLSGTPSSSLQQVFNPSVLELRPVVGQQIFALQKPLMFPQNIQYPLQLHQTLQDPGLHSQMSNMQPPFQQYGQLLAPQSDALTAFAQPRLLQQLPCLGGQLSTSQQLIQNSAAANALQTPFNLNLQAMPTVASLPQFSVPNIMQQLLHQPLLQSPAESSQVLLQQQTHALQSRFQASQQTICQLQQNLHVVQQASLKEHPNQTDKQQSAWTGQPSISLTPATTATEVLHSTMSATAPIGGTTSTAVLSTCNWTEHTSPQGFKYYYNKVTCESKWEKPEEYSLLEQQQQQQKLILSQQQQLKLVAQQQQKLVAQQQLVSQQQQKLVAQQLQSPTQSQLDKQTQLTQQVFQEQQVHSQMQMRQQVQLQVFQSPMLYQASGASSHQNIQGILGGQELAFKDKIAGS